MVILRPDGMPRAPFPFMQVSIDEVLQSFDEIRHRPILMPWLTRLAAHDIELLRHSLLVGAVAAIFAHRAELPPELQETVTIGGLLHDVGKLTISPSLLHKEEPLSTKERKELESHALRGYKMLQEEPWSDGILELVHLHHERLDGSGYPNGWAGEKLSGEVQMLALCDVFSALIEDRVYRPRPSRPLDIMTTMTDELDAELLQFFSTEVAFLVYMAKDRLNQLSYTEYTLAASA